MITFRHQIDPDLDSLTSCMEEVTHAMEEADCPAEDVFAANLFIEELVTNTLKYGFDSRQPTPVDLVVHVFPKGFTVELSDQGDPFDPFALPPPDFGQPADERPIGGLGIHLVKNLATECIYSRVDGKNLTIVKKYS
ncbi:MAG: ATP-binding protein [Terrimicrobiaceae bacterium]